MNPTSLNSSTTILLAILSIIGNTYYWVTFVNRTHASARLSHHVHRTLRKLHFLGISAWPVVMILFWNPGTDDQLTLSPISQQSVFVQTLMLITGSGSALLLIQTIRWQVSGKRCFERCIEKNAIPLPMDRQGTDYRGEPEGPGKLFPWNEIWSPQLTRKTVCIPANAAAENPSAHPLRILHLSDLHFDGTPGTDFYRQVFNHCTRLDFDLIALSGDLTDDSERVPLLADLLAPLLSRAPGTFILGNHDWRISPDAIRRKMMAAGWIDLGGRHQVLETPAGPVWLSGNESPWQHQTPPPPPRDSNCLKILISHTPDNISTAISQGYDLMLSGHTHGGQVVLPLFGPVYCPSTYGPRYASGLFRAGSMWMHVTRGLGGLHHLRWRCPPEVTILEVSRHHSSAPDR